MIYKKRPDLAFTLIEVLVSILIVSMLAAMVTTAVQGVTNTARAARTRGIIATIDSVIQEQYESYKYRPLPIVMPNFGTTESGGITYGFEVTGVEAARVRLIMRRDLLRMDFPDKKADVVASATLPRSPAVITAVANRVAANSSTGRVMRDFVDNRTQQPIDWLNIPSAASPTVGSKTDIYFRRFLGSGASWSELHEGAECLYLIMATTFVGGSPAIDAIPASNIGDLDDDGMPEILDGWGRPLGFIRWPAGYVDPTGLTNRSVPDDFDPFQADFGFSVTGQTAPWSIRPLIVSSGSDQEFGIELSSNSVAYNDQRWPTNTMNGGTRTHMGNEGNGRTDPYVFPDPFLRLSPNPLPSPLPGEIVNTNAHDDDLTNYSLEASL
jgi:prepilin-type N-terminal cleavage/methylation domain-containing protein